VRVSAVTGEGIPGLLSVVEEEICRLRREKSGSTRPA
jgi:translation initiation factor IF-2